DERLGVALLAQGQPGKLQARDPALGARRQRGDRTGRQAELHRLVKEGGGFFRGEAQRALADLRYLVAGAQAGERQWRVLTRADRDVHAGGPVLEEEGEQVVRLEGPDEVVVVQHDQRAELGAGEVVDQRGDQLRRRRPLLGLQHRLSNPAVELVEGGNQVREEGR